MKYDVFRIRVGTGLVDFCETIDAPSMTAAERIARESHPCDPRFEGLSVEAAAADDAHSGKCFS